MGVICFIVFSVPRPSPLSPTRAGGKAIFRWRRAWINKKSQYIPFDRPDVSLARAGA